MAFRRFSQPTPYRPPVFEGMPNILRAIERGQLRKAQEAETTRKAQEDLQKEIGKIERADYDGLYPKDTEIINKRATTDFDNTINDLNTVGSVSSKTRTGVSDTESFYANAKSEKDMLEGLDKTIEQIDDNFFNKDLAHARTMEQKLKVHGERDVQSINLDDPDYFMEEAYMQHHIKGQSQKDITQTVQTATGEVTTGVKGPFLDNQGNIKVTPQDANTYLNSRKDGKLHDKYNQAVDYELTTEVEDVMKGMNYLPDALQKRLRGLNNNEIKTFLINNPDMNPFDTRTFARRKLDMVAEKLRNGVHTDQKVNTDYTAKIGDEGPDLTGTERIRASAHENYYKTVSDVMFEDSTEGLKVFFSQEKGYLNPRFETEVEGPSLEGRRVIKVDLPTGGKDPVTKAPEVKAKTFPAETLQDMKEAVVELTNIYNSGIKDAAYRVDPNIIIRSMEKDPRFTEYDVDGKNYTFSQLKRKGYTDEQINEAVKLGTISKK